MKIRISRFRNSAHASGEVVGEGGGKNRSGFPHRDPATYREIYRRRYR
jgi:hypothetical protein